jgi:hypothetical protein
MNDFGFHYYGTHTLASAECVKIQPSIRSCGISSPPMIEAPPST